MTEEQQDLWQSYMLEICEWLIKQLIIFSSTPEKQRYVHGIGNAGYEMKNNFHSCYSLNKQSLFDENIWIGGN